MLKKYLCELSIAAALFALLRCSSVLAAGPEFSDVFIASQDGYKSIRIPSVVVTKQGVVLAFAEGRAADSDQAGNDIILKRSPDDGRTWLPLQLIADDGANSLNNPTAVVEQGAGRVFLMYQRIPAHMKERDKSVETGYEGTNVYCNFVTWSDDEGATWAKPVDITRTTKRPTRATTIASGPGIGIQLTRGPHKGRLIIPFNEGPYHQWNNYAVFSDDRGRNWKWGQDVSGAFVADAKLGQRSQINEVQMVELSDGSVRLNSRQFAGAKVRKTSISSDGGETWSPIEDVPALRDPSCNASILRYSFDDAQGRGRILYSGPDSTQRNNGTIHLSVDDGATWPLKRVLRSGGFAYSVLTRLPDGTVGCLFEPDDAKRILFARFSLAWLEASVADENEARANPEPKP
jgi:sialidase-1